MSFDVDFSGRLRKVRVTAGAALQAVYEAVANAFDATEYLGETGRITVRILRKPAPETLFSDHEPPAFVLDGYEVADNGVGFTDEHLGHFKKSDTTHKASGKGVGRLLWLHVFDRAEIDSVFDQGGARLARKFTFSIKNNGVNDAETKAHPADPRSESGTRVRLLGPKKERVSAIDLSVDQLAAKLLEHFLLRFTVLRGQSLSVTDGVSDQMTDVGALYKELIGDRHKEEDFEIRGSQFSLHHLFVKPTVNRRNDVNLCANRRLVTSESVSALVPEVGRTAAVTVPAQGSLRYHAYVTGPYLDEIADDERTGLKFVPDHATGDDDAEVSLLSLAPAGLEGISRRELYDQIAIRIRDRLSEHLAGVRQHKEKLLENFAAGEQPQFRPFLEGAKKHLERLPAKPSKKAIELALYEAKIDGRDEMEKLVAQIVSLSPSHKQAAEMEAKLVEQFARAANAHNVSALAEHVCARRAILKVLERNLGINRENKTELERVIHNLIFPMITTSDVVPAGLAEAGERQVANLWLIDDRLVFHQLLTSDLALSQLRNFLSDSAREPDIVVFDPAFATTDDVPDLKTIAVTVHGVVGPRFSGPFGPVACAVASRGGVP